MKTNQRGAFWGLAIFAIAWSSGVLFFDGSLAVGVFQAIQSRDFLTVEGNVLRCEAKKTSSGEEESWAIDIDYAYTVHDERYVGSRFRFGPSSPGEGMVTKFAEEHPTDSAITVYYDPANPESSVLRPGLSNSAIFLFVFLWPFNLVMLILWTYFAGKMFLTRRSLLRVGYGVCIIEREGETRVRLPKLGPLAAAALAAFVVGIVTCFPAFCCVYGGVPVVSMVVITFIMELVIILSVYASVAIRNASGKADLVIDKLQQTVALPRNVGRSEQIVFPLASFRAVKVVEEVKKTVDDSSTVHVATAVWIGPSGDQTEGKVMELDSEEHAREIAAMIRESIAAGSVVGDDLLKQRRRRRDEELRRM